MLIRGLPIDPLLELVGMHGLYVSVCIVCVHFVYFLFALLKSNEHKKLRDNPETKMRGSMGGSRRAERMEELVAKQRGHSAE